jgi:hypothetical protein
MKKVLMLVATVVAAAAVVPVAAADNDPFPSTKAAQVFVTAQTVTTSGAINTQFAPGSTVVFRAYALDVKTRKAVAKKDVRFFYVTVPNQPNVKLKYTPTANTASGRYVWTGSWNVPADYPVGTVPFVVHVKTWKKHTGQFVQMPVASAMLTIAKSPQNPLGNPPAQAAPGAANSPLGLYADTVNGTRPTGAAPRPVGCTQTNVWKRGEQLVVRAWGYDLATGDLLTNDNVNEAHFSVPGQSNVTLNWGAHGATGQKVFFWANAWNIPSDYPLGDVVVTVSFTTVSGKTGTLEYPITIIP